MIHKRKPLKGNVKLINRFNRDPQYSNFANEFQEIMIQRLNLNYTRECTKENIEKIIRFVVNRPPFALNTKIKGGFLLSCNIEPELYLKIQDTAKRIIGTHVPMDALIHNLLAYFCYIYNGPLPKQQLPYNHKFKGRSMNKLRKFQKYFGKYYSNAVSNFNE